MTRRLRVRLLLPVFGIVAGIGFVACLVGSVLVFSLWHTEPCFRPLNHDALTTNALRGVRVVTPERPVAFTIAGHLVQAAPATEDDLRDYLPEFAEEFNIYPNELVRRIQLNHIILCTHLSQDAKPFGGLADCERGDLYLDVGYLAVNPAYSQRVMHHEFFHLLDSWSHGNIFEDAGWSALNPPEFRYGEGGWSGLSDLDTITECSDLIPGFLNLYSTTAVEEDKAELFAFLIVHPKRMAERVRLDPVLRAKVALIKAQLVAFSPDMDDSFWERVRVRRNHE